MMQDYEIDIFTKPRSYIVEANSEEQAKMMAREMFLSENGAYVGESIYSVEVR